MEALLDFVAINYETVTVAATAVGITSTVTTAGTLRRGQRALITAETAQMRYTYNGTTPTTTVGHILEAGQSIEVIGFASIDAFSIIRTGGTSGTIQVTMEVY